jgi:hypothetical protein
MKENNRMDAEKTLADLASQFSWRQMAKTALKAVANNEKLLTAEKKFTGNEDLLSFTDFNQQARSS